MFRLWGKCVKENHLVRDLVISDPDDSKSRTRRILDSVTELCRAFDLAEPIWLDSNISEFQRSSKTRFRQDNFIESLEFDYLEIQIIEE